MKTMMEPRGYRAMLRLLARRNQERPSEEMQGLLEELRLGPEGLPSEAAREAWNEDVKAVFTDAPETLTSLHLS